MIANFWECMFQYVDKLRTRNAEHPQYPECLGCSKAKAKCHLTCKAYKEFYSAQIGDAEVRTAREIEDILQKVYDDGNKYRNKVKGFEPQTDLEAAVSTISNIRIYKDSEDLTYFYSLDGRHFDSAREVFDHLKAVRAHKVKVEMADEKRLIREKAQKIIYDCARSLKGMDIQRMYENITTEVETNDQNN